VHFLLLPELAGSPPNDALVRAYFEAGLAVDFFALGDGQFAHSSGDEARTFPAEYGYRWSFVGATRVTPARPGSVSVTRQSAAPASESSTTPP
jgi:hypothetical protein